jgi:hypothetical protein
MEAPPQAGQYRVIYADPPWRFATYSDKGKGRSAEAHYDCLSLDEIKAFPVAAWAALDMDGHHSPHEHRGSIRDVHAAIFRTEGQRRVSTEP